MQNVDTSIVLYMHNEITKLKKSVFGRTLEFFFFFKKEKKGVDFSLKKANTQSCRNGTIFCILPHCFMYQSNTIHSLHIVDVLQVNKIQLAYLMPIYSAPYLFNSYHSGLLTDEHMRSSITNILHSSIIFCDIKHTYFIVLLVVFIFHNIMYKNAPRKHVIL